MSKLSSAAQHALHRLMSPPETPEEGRRQTASVTWGPTIRKVSEPVKPLSDLVSAMDDGALGRAPNSWLRKQSGKREALAARECCMQLIVGLERRASFLPLPSEHTCSKCGTVYALENGMREQRV